MKAYEHITDAQSELIARQHMFFVATAPLAEDGHVNLSPKGLDSFVVLGPDRVAYLDLGGSGIETHAHLRENGRICLMFCAFDGDPLIVRLYGRGTAHAFGAPDVIDPSGRASISRAGATVSACSQDATSDSSL